MTVLVVGGNGQLGSECCRMLLARGAGVRATVRTRERGEFLTGKGVEVRELDLTAGSIPRCNALVGCEVVILSANSVVPLAGDDVVAFDRALREFVSEAAAHGVRRIVLPSLPTTRIDDRVPFAAARRSLESQILASFDGAVLRLPPFMECWFALVGSSLPLRGEQHPTIGRPSPFLARFRRLSGSLVEDRGLMLLPGPADARHAFISVRDAARACVEAALRTEAMPEPVEVAGPEILAWRDVAALFGAVLGRRVRVASTPGFVYAAVARALEPIARVPARTMALNRLMASSESAWDNPGGGLLDPASLTTAAELLRGKAALDENGTAVN